MSIGTEKLLVESLLISGSSLRNIHYHNERMNRTRRELFQAEDYLDLKAVITQVPRGTHKCRVIYSDRIHEIHYLPCHTVERKTFRFIESDISYRYKYTDRETIQCLFAQKKDADDIIIVKNGLITDASTSNVAFFNGNTWITPAHPLLPGTTRQRYLDNGILEARDITVREAKKCRKMALLNAMIDFQEIENPRFYP